MFFLNRVVFPSTGGLKHLLLHVTEVTKRCLAVQKLQWCSGHYITYCIHCLSPVWEKLIQSEGGWVPSNTQNLATECFHGNQFLGHKLFLKSQFSSCWFLCGNLKMPSLNSSWPASQSPNLKLSNIVHQLSAPPLSAAFLCHSYSSSSKPFSCLHQSKKRTQKRKFKFQCVFAKISVLQTF